MITKISRKGNKRNYFCDTRELYAKLNGCPKNFVCREWFSTMDEVRSCIMDNNLGDRLIAILPEDGGTIFKYHGYTVLYWRSW